MADPLSALLIIDTQLAFFEAPQPLYQAEKLIENIKTLIGKARDAHIPVIYVQHNASGDLEWMNNTPLKNIHPQVCTPEYPRFCTARWQSRP